MKIFRDRRLVLAAVAALFFSARFALADELEDASVDEATAAAAPEEPPPLPFHSIEGVGGGAITPMAYLVNPGDECHVGMSTRNSGAAPCCPPLATGIPAASTTP